MACSRFSVSGRVSASLSSKAQPVIAARSWPNSVLPEPANPPTSTRDVSAVGRERGGAPGSGTPGFKKGKGRGAFRGVFPRGGGGRGQRAGGARPGRRTPRRGGEE